MRSAALQGGAVVAAIVAIVLAGCGGESGGESKESFTNETWETVVSDPSSYASATVELFGEVGQVQHDEERTYIEVWMDARNLEQQTVVVYNRPDFNPIGNYIRVLGTVGEKFEGETQFGVAVTLPTVDADSVESLIELPAHTTYPSVSSTKGRVRITVTTIQAAPNETRVAIDIDNESASDFSFYPSRWKLVANGRVIKTRDRWEAVEVTAHSAYSVYVVFKPISKDADLRLTIEGTSENLAVGKDGTLTWTWTWK